MAERTEILHRLKYGTGIVHRHGRKRQTFERVVHDNERLLQPVKVWEILALDLRAKQDHAAGGGGVDQLGAVYGGKVTEGVHKTHRALCRERDEQKVIGKIKIIVQSK